MDARRQPNLQNAPQVRYSAREPPLELSNVRGLGDHPNLGYVSFSTSTVYLQSTHSLALFPRHYAEGAAREATITTLHTFRNYLHYHIKCSKAYMHCRMRAKVDEFLKVLRRG